MTTLTIELRTGDSVITTVKLADEDKSWHDVNNENSPFTITQGAIDDSAYGQLRCMGNGTEILRIG
ncbi:MAG TPA: hypothetical protein VJY15_06685 [Candidatus Acidoferrum sp.]|nr:hypothetical protein [Candidatus Acidoferrum sp.]